MESALDDVSSTIAAGREKNPTAYCLLPPSIRTLFVFLLSFGLHIHILRLHVHVHVNVPVICRMVGFGREEEGVRKNVGWVGVVCVCGGGRGGGDD
jgi:hypothetical protein